VPGARAGEVTHSHYASASQRVLLPMRLSLAPFDGNARSVDDETTRLLRSSGPTFSRTRLPPRTTTITVPVWRAISRARLAALSQRPWDRYRRNSAFVGSWGVDVGN